MTRHTNDSRDTGERLGARVLRRLSSAAPDDAEAVTVDVLRELGEHFGYTLAVLWSLDEEGMLRWRADWAASDAHEAMRRVVRRLTFVPGVGLPGRVLEHAEAAWIEDIEAETLDAFPRRAAALESGLRAGVAVPVSTADRPLGVLELFGPQVRRPTPAEVEDMALVAGQLGGYLGRLRVEERLLASEESSASIVAAALDCVITMDHHGRVIDFNPAAEATFGYSRDVVAGELLADLIIPPELRPAHQESLERYLETGTGRILGQRLELNGMRADGSMLPVELTVTRLGRTQPPVFVGFIRDISERHRAEAEQSRLLQEALVARAQAEAASVRTESAREEAELALAQAERARAQLAFLAQAGREMAASMDWESTLRAVVRSAVGVVADFASLTVVERRERLRVVALAHADPEREGVAEEIIARYPPDAADLAGVAAAIRSGIPEVRSAIGPHAEVELARDATHAELLRRLEIAHSAVVPLMTASRVIGALTFGRGPDGPEFGDADLELLTSLAARAALHIHNARLYTEQSEIAHTLQASLQPRALPEIPGVDIAARFRPAGDHNEVGGDFYEVFRSGDGVWTAIVGDVSGKGAEAAAVTSLARHTLRTSSLLHDDPHVNLELLNRVMYDEAAANRFCTVVYARLCPAPDGLDVRLSNGGHPAPLVVRADGSLEALDTGRGPIVGALPDVAFEEATLILAPGDLLVMFTDGVTEVSTRDVGLGERALHAALRELAGSPAEEIVAAIERGAVELQSASPRDDIAVLALRAR